MAHLSLLKKCPVMFEASRELRNGLRPTGRIVNSKTYSMIFRLLITCLVYTVSLQDVPGQQTVDVTEQTIKIGGMKEEEIYIGFAAGDKIVFSFKETNRKELKEVEILEYPSNSRFSDFKVDKIERKELSVSKQAVYIFRFKNSALGGRVCNIQIQRIPANESTKEFNTAVKWVNRQDTVWNSFTKDVLIGYDTTYQQRTKKELVTSQQQEELIMDKAQRVHSTTNANGNKTTLFFVLPLNQTEGNKTKRVIAWAYWVGVGEEANEALPLHLGH
jgi:hypothetical protein